MLLLTHGYFIAEDKREQEIMKPYPPLGILYISSFLKKSKIEHEVFDTTFSTFDELCTQLKKRRYKQVAFYVNLMTKLNVLKTIQFIRSQDDLRDTTVILGGPDVRYNAENYIQHGADIIVLGEGEETMADLISNLNTPFNPFLDKVPGIAFKNYFGKVVFTDERVKIKEISDLPFPNREAIQMEKYLTAWKKRHGLSAMSISTQRGCPYTCHWCSTAVYGQSYRRRTPASVCDELEYLMKTYHPDTFWFVDDVFTVSHKWMQEFRNEVVKRKLVVRYECITRADRLSQDVINWLKETGCFRLWIGAESGSQDVIDAMDRRVDIDVVRDMLLATRKAGIETGTFIMLGYPGETMKDIMETVDHLVQSNPHHFTITLAYPIKGTQLYQQTQDNFLSPPAWESSTDRDIDFQRTFPREFYPYAIRFVVNEVNFRRLPKWKKILSPKAWVWRLKSILAQEKMQQFRPL